MPSLILLFSGTLKSKDRKTFGCSSCGPGPQWMMVRTFRLLNFPFWHSLRWESLDRSMRKDILYIFPDPPTCFCTHPQTLHSHSHMHKSLTSCLFPGVQSRASFRICPVLCLWLMIYLLLNNVVQTSESLLTSLIQRSGVVFTDDCLPSC